MRICFRRQDGLLAPPLIGATKKEMLLNRGKEVPCNIDHDVVGVWVSPRKVHFSPKSIRKVRGIFQTTTTNKFDVNIHINFEIYSNLGKVVLQVFISVVGINVCKIYVITM